MIFFLQANSPYILIIHSVVVFNWGEWNGMSEIKGKKLCKKI